jgi:hypothetical protein
MKKLILILAVIVLLLTPVFLKSKASYESQHEPEPLPKEVTLSDLTMPQLVDYYAGKHGVNKATMNAVVKCESGYNPKAVNWSDSHKLSKGSHGIAQFSQQTFEQYAKAMGETYTDPYNPNQALDVMGYMLSINQGKHWTCYTKLYGI